MKFKQNKIIPDFIRDVIRLPLSLINGGFTLIEILVTVLIIGILAAIAVPQYQRAVLKSRYAGLMPIAKAMTDSNEAYFLEHGVYADKTQDLPVQGNNRPAFYRPGGYFPYESELYLQQPASKRVNGR